MMKPHDHLTSPLPPNPSASIAPRSFSLQSSGWKTGSWTGMSEPVKRCSSRCSGVMASASPVENSRIAAISSSSITPGTTQ